MEALYKLLDRALGYICHYYLIVKEELTMFLYDFLFSLLYPFITESGCKSISEVVSVIVTTALFLKVTILLYKGLGVVIAQIVDLLFNRGSAGADFLLKSIIYRMFSSVAWIFSSIAEGVKKILFSK